MPFLAAAAPYIAVAAAVGGTIIGVAGMQAQQQAAQQAAANAQAVANYNAQVQEQNNQLAFAIATQQAQYQAQAAQLNQQLALQNAEIAQAQAMAQSKFYDYSAKIARENARSAAELTRQRFEAQIRTAQEYERMAETERAQTREQASRIREEGDKRTAIIRAKYGGSGILLEGSPLVVLSDAASLIETSVQDAMFIGELEARKQFRAAEIGKFEAGFTLLEGAIEQRNYARDIFEAKTQQFSVMNLGGAQSYEYQIQALNAENQIMAATYDTHVAAAKLKIGANEAELIRMGGQAQSSNILAESRASSISGMANIIGGIGSTAMNLSQSSLFQPRTSRTPGVIS